MADNNQKNPKEASNIFHSIMKASVKPPKSDKIMESLNDKIIKAVKERFNVELENDEQIGIIFPSGIDERLVVEINQYCAKLKTENKL